MIQFYTLVIYSVYVVVIVAIVAAVVVRRSRMFRNRLWQNSEAQEAQFYFISRIT